METKTQSKNGIHSKGQIGFEYLVFTAFLLAMTLVIFVYAFTIYSENVRTTQVDSALQQLVSAGDFVYARGPGNSTLLTISLPDGVNSITRDRNAIIIHTQLLAGATDFIGLTKAQITSIVISPSKGFHNIIVSIGDANITILEG